jgi:RNA polymerase sigma-70 factor (sigma-E family)
MGALVSVGEVTVTDFDAFYEQERPHALRLAALLGQDRASAEDVVQEAFAIVFRHWDRLETPKAYLRTVLVNITRTKHRKAERERDRLIKLGPCDSTALHADEISDALATLPYRQRAVLVLYYYGDLKDREIADALQCSVGTIKSLKSRALARLRKDIEQ